MLSISKLGLGSSTLVLHNSTFGPGSSKLVLGNWISVVGCFQLCLVVLS